MALSLTQLQAATNDWYDNQVSDIFFQMNVLLWKLMGNGGMEENLITGADLADGGQKLRVFLEYDEANGGEYGADTEIDYSQKDIINAARFDWGGYQASNSINLKEKTQNFGAPAMIKLAKKKLMNIQNTIRNKMGTGIYTARGTGDGFSGLADIFNTTTSTAYGGIAEDDMALWKANKLTTARAISYKVVQEIVRTAAVNSNNAGRPDLAITTDTLVDGYKRTLQVQQRFRSEKLAEVGFDNIMHDAHLTIVQDNKQTAGYFDALNTRYLKIKTHPEYNFTKPEWLVIDHRKPDSVGANIRWQGQLLNYHRKAHCRHTGLTEPA